jgi:CRP/FNR family transcriptional regulator, cAMP and macrophage regulator
MPAQSEPKGGRQIGADRQSQWIAQCVGRPELAPLDPDDIDELGALLQEEHFPAGATIFGVGDAPTRVAIVRSGAVEMSCVLNGRRVVVQILRPGDVVGDVALLLRMTSPYDGVALQDTVLLTVDSLQFYRLLEKRPRLARRWMVSISSRMISYQSRLLELLAGGLEAQIASVLVRRADRGVVTLSQSNLAELVGGRRTSVNRVLKRLEEQQLVRVRYGQVDIIDEAALAKLAGL